MCLIGLRSDGKNFPSINRPALDNCYMLENTINREVVICSNYQQYCKMKDVKKADVNVWKVMPFRFISQDFAMSETFLFGEGAILDTSLLMEVESSEERSAMTADVSVDQALPMPLEYSDYGCKLAVDVVRIFECGIIPGSAVPSVKPMCEWCLSSRCSWTDKNGSSSLSTFCQLYIFIHMHYLTEGISRVSKCEKSKWKNWIRDSSNIIAVDNVGTYSLSDNWFDYAIKCKNVNPLSNCDKFKLL